MYRYLYVLVSPWDGKHWPIKQSITCTTPNTIYVVMCTIHNDWYVAATTNLRARRRSHQPNAKLKKATKCGVAYHVTRFPHPDGPHSLAFSRSRQLKLLEKRT